MAKREYHYRWEWRLQASPVQLWPLVADTNRFDRDAGVPAVSRLDADSGELLDNSRARVRVRQYGVKLDYVQDPFEWDEPRRFSVTRHFLSGPLLSLRMQADLGEREDGGTDLVYQVWATPRRAVFGIAIPIQIGLLLARRFERTFRRYDELASTGDLSTRTGGRVELVRGARERLAEQRRGLLDDGVPARIADHLIELVSNDDDVAVARLRPYVLADRWGAGRRDTIEAFLLATRAGMFELRWDVLCPMCRIAKASTGELDELPSTIHCDVCNIDYGANFAQSVELTFTPNPSIRTVDRNDYCIGNPMATPHIVQQQLVPAGGAIETGGLERGRYRLRSFGSPGGMYLRVGGDGAAELDVALDASGWPDDEPDVKEGAVIDIRNALDVEQLLILERTAIGDQAVMAREVTAMQRFRDLFADEALRPGEKIAVGSMAIVFTDLCDSTELYQQIGDAVAFGRVLDHFAVLHACVAEEGGSVVKTIGDAVMAVFPTPAPAVRAMLEAQRRVGVVTGEDDRPLMLKAGVHFGPCIAVNLNDRLDYFGSTVNLAARVQGCARGGDVVVSARVYEDPEVGELLADAGDTVGRETLTSSLKGFDEEFMLWRLVADMDRGPGAIGDKVEAWTTGE